MKHWDLENNKTIVLWQTQRDADGPYKDLKLLIEVLFTANDYDGKNDTPTNNGHGTALRPD